MFSVADDVPQGLFGDPLRVSQILTNLIGNAIKFTEQGAVQVPVRRLERGDAGRASTSHIADTGIGMPPEKTRQALLGFSQADGSTTRRYGGTGLGLTIIVKRLAELMDGDVEVESEAGVGSTFRVTAGSASPSGSGRGRRCRSRSFAGGDKARSALPQAAAPNLTGIRVLLVEDNAVNQQLRAIAARIGEATAGGDGAALGAVLRRLERTLADGDGEALDCALAAQELLERALGAPEAGALLREVGNFDFDAALIRVRSLAARLAPGPHRLITWIGIVRPSRRPRSLSSGRAARGPGGGLLRACECFAHFLQHEGVATSCGGAIA